MSLETYPFDVSEYLDTEEGIAEYLRLVCLDGSPTEIARALGEVAAGLDLLERRGHREDRTVALAGVGAPSAEGAAVAHPLDVELDGRRDVARPQEVPVQRVRQPARLDGAARGEQRLGEHLAAEHPARRQLDRVAGERVRLRAGAQGQDVEDGTDRVVGRRVGGVEHAGPHTLADQVAQLAVDAGAQLVDDRSVLVAERGELVVEDPRDRVVVGVVGREGPSHRGHLRHRVRRGGARLADDVERVHVGDVGRDGADADHHCGGAGTGQAPTVGRGWGVHGCRYLRERVAKYQRSINGPRWGES